MTASSRLHWWIATDAGLAARIGIGAGIFLVLALVDLRRHGRSARRWREYAFLGACVAVALLYGIINDLITCRISWEYFYYGKGLSEMLGPVLPPAPGPLSWEAAKVGMKATWTAGLIVGVVLLLANNPSARRPQLPWRALMNIALKIVLFAAAMGCLLGCIGYAGGLRGMMDDIGPLLGNAPARVARFQAVYGVHLGGYAGGALGMIAAAVDINRRRRKRA